MIFSRFRRAGAQRSPAAGKDPRRKRSAWRRPLVRVAGAIALALVLWPVLFIGTRCYGNGTSSTGGAPPPAGISGYARDPSLTFLTLPEWFIVYSTEEYANFIGRQPPSRFPYFRSAAQYWSYYGSICSITGREYPFNAGAHVMLAVIGMSFTVENGLKGLYEATIGRLSEWIGNTDTPEDAFARRVALEYGRFMHTVPWYEFPFGTRLRTLWNETPLVGPHVVRKWERRLSLTAEYGVKAVYGWFIYKATKSAFGDADLRLFARVNDAPDEIFRDQRVRKVQRLGERSWVIDVPRYEEFTHIALALQAQGVRFADIAGNDAILVTAIVPRDLLYASSGTVILGQPILTSPSTKRIAVRAPVNALHEIMEYIKSSGGAVEHLYDY